MDANNNAAEISEQRKKLLAEAASLKVRIDETWSDEQIEKVVAKKRNTVSKPAETPAKPVQEGADDDVGEDDVESEEVASLKAQLADAATALAAANTEVARLNEKLKVQGQMIFDLESVKSKVETELFDLKAAAAGIKEKPELTEDFGGKKEKPVATAAPEKPAEEMVTCRVTKLGDGKISTGNIHAPKETYKRHDVVTWPADVAKANEEKGWVETD